MTSQSTHAGAPPLSPLRRPEARAPPRPAHAPLLRHPNHLGGGRCGTIDHGQRPIALLALHWTPGPLAWGHGGGGQAILRGTLRRPWAWGAFNFAWGAPSWGRWLWHPAGALLRRPPLRRHRQGSQASKMGEAGSQGCLSRGSPCPCPKGTKDDQARSQGCLSRSREATQDQEGRGARGGGAHGAAFGRTPRACLRCTGRS